MSTTELSRSTLESKDKDELHQIASAMGAKPGSRARKGEIVDLILDLAMPSSSSSGSGNGGSGNGASSAPSAPADTPPQASPVVRSRPVARVDSFSFDPMADARAEAARKRAREAGEPEPEPERIDVPGLEDEPAATTPSGETATTHNPSDETASSGGSDAASGDGESASTEQRSGQQGGNQGDRNQGDRNQGDRNPGDRNQGDRNQGDRNPGDRNQGDRNQGDRNPGDRNQGDRNQGGTYGDDEPGNRKRRRRGRNRDRERGGEQEPVGGGAPPEDWDGEPVEVAGYLDLRDDGYGFLRVKGMLPSKDDVYVPVKQARQFGLRKGDHLKGASRPAGRSEKNPALLRLDEINGLPPEMALRRPRFEDLTPLFPDERLKLERTDDPTNMTARIVDLISPIGKGQRGLIVSPPKAGKTTIMKEIARSIELNNPEVKVLVLLVDERPEEVTDMRRWLVNGDVIASTFDRPSDEHTMVAELTIERAKRLVEMGQDVVIILDGITRLARAYNLAAPATGRIMSGGVDSGALYPPKRFFGAARNVEEGGSLTILATALVETGSKMDEVIFEEFKGTGNMELRLDRRTAERRIYPAIDVDASSTRHEELLFERKQLQQVWKLRRVLSGMAAEGANAPGLELLIDRLKTFNNNDEFLAEVAKGPVG